MLDVLSYMCPTPQFSSNYHLASRQQGVNPQFFWSTPKNMGQSGWLYYIKNPTGFPWDINCYDNNYVYQCITEGPSGWTDPTSYKQFASSSWPGGHGGIAWSPRYLQPLPFTNFVITLDTTYKTFLAGNLVDTQNLGPVVQTLVQGPYQLVVGSLGTQNVIVQTYLWGQGLAVMEQTYYAFGLGVVRWREYALDAGVYKLKIDNLFDVKTEGGAPEPNFPNPLP